MTATITGQNFVISDESLTVSESVGIYECDFTFDESWNGWQKTAVFQGSGETIEVIIVDGKAQIPWEVLKENGWMRVGVYGTRNAQVKPTIWSGDIYVSLGTPTESTEIEPTPSTYAQILELANSAKETAEDVAEDWASVTAEASTLAAGSPASASFANNKFTFGIPQGPKGDTGATGATGATPAFSIGTVTTLETGQPASASVTGTAAQPVLNLGLPKGNKGDNGDVANTAPAYSTSATYSVGDYCMYNSQLYRCTTAISTAEAWTAAHWTAVQLGGDVSTLRSALNATNDAFNKKIEQEIPQNFFDRAEVSEQLEYTYAEGLYVDDVNSKAKAGSYNSYGFKVPTGGRYYFSSPGDFVSEEMTEAGQVFSFHQAITAGWNNVPCAGYYYKYNSTSIYAYGTTIVSYENLLKRGNVFSYVEESASVRYTQGAEVQATTVNALIAEAYIGSYGSSYRLKSFAVAKGKTYIFKCDAYASAFDVPLMMFVKYGKPDTYSTRAYGCAMPYRANKVKSFEIPFYAVEDGFIYVQTNNSDTLTIKCYEITNLESIPKQYPQYNKMLTIGDSLTSNGIWQPVVRENLFIPQSSTVAVAGKCISNNGDDPIYSAVMALTTDSAVDLITLWAGTNDFAANVTIGTMEEQIAIATRDNTTFYGGVLDCVEHLINLYPKKRIIMIGTTPRTWDSGASNYQSTPNGSGKYLRDYVDAFHDVAKYYGLPFLDLLRTSGINLLNIGQYMQQQEISGTTYYLHPTTEGYKYIGGLISAFIKSVG